MIDHARLVRFVAGIVGPNDAEDVVQEVYVKLLQPHKPYRGAAGVETWVFAIAKNAAMDFLKARGPRTASVDDVAQKDESCRSRRRHRESPLAVDPVEPEELSEEMQAALATLTVKQRAAILACAKHGPSVEDAAAWLGIPTGTYRNRLLVARKLLREALGDQR